MRPTFVVAAALFLLSGIAVAEAADSTQLAEAGGFLLGNAHRCGVPTERVEQAGKVIQDLIVSASNDSKEQSVADLRFVEMFMASAVLDPERNVLVPPCNVVIVQFKRLEQHHLQSGMD